jgi:hypothetical protein
MKGAYKNDIKQLTNLITFAFTFTTGFGLGILHMWWDQLVQVQHIKEKSITWREFKKYFEKKYLTKRYYNKKMKEFFELKLGSTTID